MKTLKTLFAFAVFTTLCILAHPAFAQTPPAAPNGEVTISWTVPTLYVDGSAIDPTNITKYQVWLDTVAIPAIPFKTPIDVLMGTQVGVPVVLPAGGTIFIRAATCTKSTATIGFTCGSASGMVTKAIPPQVILSPKVPGPPTNITILIRINPVQP